ncbi:hypothetical protein SRABI83_01881 [Arthrobacter sp. Bi83]|jgi:hypothetical protein|uniref:hypothetical protein n=1 Tax=Arthrobacter sp. Bi83 TaxID=2822353 RepID=UPI001D1AB5D7|nr:hypothetical protein [Arthrobacter sp. Bi83]CAH0200068.1 hypothetical protein SRABI83_01881 [Arthrobacter sp. Bi83]
MSKDRGKQHRQLKASPPSIIDQSPAITLQGLQPSRAFASGAQNLDHHAGRPERDLAVADEKTKQNLRYCDYYCFMSLKDFTAWVQRDDESDPSISYSVTALATELPFY